jgi:hypothetical protein
MSADIRYKPVFISHVETPGEIYFQQVSTDAKAELEK